MDELVKALSAEIKAEARRAVEEFFKAIEMFAGLQDVSTTQEMAKVFRVSDDVLRRTAEEGMPHVHFGREMRFVKARLVEWATTGKQHFCEVCEEKSGKSSPQTPAASNYEQPQYSPFSHKSTSLNSKIKGDSPTSLRQNDIQYGKKRTGQIREIAPGKFRIKIQRGTGARRISFDETFAGTREEAEEYIRSCLETITEFEAMPERAKTVADLLNDYITRRAAPNVRAKTLLDKNNMLTRYIAPNLGDVPIRDLKAGDVRKFYEDLSFGDFVAGFREKGVVKPRRAESGLSAQTIKKVHTTLKAAFAYAYEMEWLDRNPLATVTAPKTKIAKRRIPTVEEREKLFAVCRSVSERALWMFAYFTGTRPEEYLAARWSDLNLDKAQWSIERAKVEMPGGLKAILWEEPKTEKSRRKAPLVPRLVAVLREYRQLQAEYRSKLGERWQDNELIFPARHGTARLTSNVNRQFKELLKLAELPTETRPYDLRHAFATHLLDSGATLKDVSELLGHSSIRVTADVYVQVSEKRKHSIVALLDGSA